MGIAILVTSPRSNARRDRSASRLIMPTDQALAQPHLARLVMRMAPQQGDAPVVRPQIVGMVGLFQIRELVVGADEEQAAIQRHDGLHLPGRWTPRRAPARRPARRLAP